MEEQRRFASGDNPEGIAFDSALVALQQAKWRLDVPLVVLMRDQVPPEEQPPEWSHERETRLLATWREVQTELAARSSHGRLMVAERSGHNIHRCRGDTRGGERCAHSQQWRGELAAEQSWMYSISV
jgi:hypothetical protein